MRRRVELMKRKEKKKKRSWRACENGVQSNSLGYLLIAYRFLCIHTLICKYVNDVRLRNYYLDLNRGSRKEFLNISPARPSSVPPCLFGSLPTDRWLHLLTSHLTYSIPSPWREKYYSNLRPTLLTTTTGRRSLLARASKPSKPS